ncbi:MAG: hypothetical protein J6X44_09075, partial [Thermoguttaceae bacterium]|nr:hypothetical protein [Thermoguttaceae bacterium]
DIVDFSDGFLFVGFSKEAELSLREPNEVDKARNLRHAANIKHGPDPRRDDSIVLRYAFDPEQVSVNGGGYTIIDSDSNIFTGRISVYNFDDKSQKLPVHAKAFVMDENGEAREVDNVVRTAVQSVDAVARGCSEIEFSLDVTNISPFNSPTLFFEVGNEGRLSFKLNRSVTEQNFDSVVNAVAAVDLSDISRWRKNASHNHHYEFKTDTNESSWGFDIEFDDGDKWAYPVFKLPINVSSQGVPYLNASDSDGSNVKIELSRLKGVAFSVKASSDVPDGLVRVFFHNEKGEYYFTAAGVMKTDGKERFIAVPYDSLNAYGGTPDSFDPSKIRAVSIGGNSKGKNLTVEVKRFCFFN